MTPIDRQRASLLSYIAVSGRRGRSEDEIIAWGRAPQYKSIIGDLETAGIVYHSSKLFSGVRYHATRRS